MNNWDIYEAGITSLGMTYLLALFNNSIPTTLDIFMLLFFGWMFLGGGVVFIIEGGIDK